MLKLYDQDGQYLGQLSVEDKTLKAQGSNSYRQAQLETLVNDLLTHGVYLRTSQSTDNVISENLTQITPSHPSYLDSVRDTLIFQGYIVKKV